MSEETEAPLPTRDRPRARGCWAVWIDGDAREHVATDVSAGGLFLLGVTHYVAGDRVRVEIDLDGARVTTAATVRWVRANRIGPGLLAGCGVAFDPLPSESLDVLLASLRPVEEA